MVKGLIEDVQQLTEISQMLLKDHTLLEKLFKSLPKDP